MCRRDIDKKHRIVLNQVFPIIGFQKIKDHKLRNKQTNFSRRLQEKASFQFHRFPLNQ